MNRETPVADLHLAVEHIWDETP